MGVVLMKKPELSKTDLERRIQELMAGQNISVHDYYGHQAKIGVVSDTHLGSLKERVDVLHSAYKVFKHEGIDSVYHAGDLIDGFGMYNGQIFEQYVVGFEAQLAETVERYPQFDGITTYFITGSHDLSYYKKNGAHIGRAVSQKRKDLVHLGDEQADVLIGGKRTVVMRLVHPGKGTAYALSYNPQKFIEALTGGDKPQILLIGHFHKAEYLPHYRNVCSVQCGALQDQTPFMMRNNNAAHVGFWTLEFEIGKSGLASLDARFYPHYERAK